MSKSIALCASLITALPFQFFSVNDQTVEPQLDYPGDNNDEALLDPLVYRVWNSCSCRHPTGFSYESYMNHRDDHDDFTPTTTAPSTTFQGPPTYCWETFFQPVQQQEKKQQQQQQQEQQKQPQHEEQRVDPITLSAFNRTLRELMAHVKQYQATPQQQQQQQQHPEPTVCNQQATPLYQQPPSIPQVETPASSQNVLITPTSFNRVLTNTLSDIEHRLDQLQQQEPTPPSMSPQEDQHDNKKCPPPPTHYKLRSITNNKENHATRDNVGKEEIDKTFFLDQLSLSGQLFSSSPSSPCGPPQSPPHLPNTTFQTQEALSFHDQLISTPPTKTPTPTPTYHSKYDYRLISLQTNKQQIKNVTLLNNIEIAFPATTPGGVTTDSHIVGNIPTHDLFNERLPPRAVHLNNEIDAIIYVTHDAEAVHIAPRFHHKADRSVSRQQEHFQYQQLVSLHLFDTTTMSINCVALFEVTWGQVTTLPSAVFKAIKHSSAHSTLLLKLEN